MKTRKKYMMPLSELIEADEPQLLAGSGFVEGSTDGTGVYDDEGHDPGGAL